MTTTTIEFGIDLGTTNSAIAWLRGVEPEVIKNLEGGEITPSVVRIVNAGQMMVGARARQRVFDDADNIHAEFKRLMGTDRTYSFPRAGIAMKPEELSAEVLKVLRAAAASRCGHNIDAAVVTVPAAFELPANEATRRAAVNAGLTTCRLLMEPVAAALAYGFQAADAKAYWLVYDLGGGTFDAALMSMRDEECRVVNHLGDNDLGGQLLDWAIVDRILVPRVVQEFHLDGFERGNPLWKGQIAVLKYAAEAAKIALSSGAPSSLLEAKFADGKGGQAELFCDLTRSDVERLADPIIDRTIRKCQDLLTQRHLGAADVDRVILVGGPTQMPYLRERLEAALRIPLNFDRDPFTVVAQGAAIFAGSQVVDALVSPSVPTGTFSISFSSFSPQGAEPEPWVGGQVASPLQGDLSDYTVQFFNRSIAPQWSSAQLGLSPSGTFQCQLFAERGKENRFEIELRDGQGARVSVSPDAISYRIGATVSETSLTHNVGIGLADGHMDWIGRKGEVLPLRATAHYRSSVDIARGSDGSLKIPICEGQSARADRNRKIGQVVVPGTDMRRDLPAGSEIELAVEIDRNRLVRVVVYIPFLDDEFEKELDYREFSATTLTVPELAASFDRERKRLDDTRKRVDETSDPEAKQALQRIDHHRMVNEVEQALGEARALPDAAQRCEGRLAELQIALDALEAQLEWPSAVKAAEREIDEDLRIARDATWEATPAEKAEILTLVETARRAIAARDADAVAHSTRLLSAISFAIVFRHPGWLSAQLESLASRAGTMSDRATAAALVKQGRGAVQNGDVGGLVSAVQQLWRLLPVSDPDRQRYADSTVQRI